jgi:hypothetical protein
MTQSIDFYMSRVLTNLFMSLTLGFLRTEIDILYINYRLADVYLSASYHSYELNENITLDYISLSSPLSVNTKIVNRF